MAIIKNNQELDSTILIVGGLGLAAIVIIGVFVLHFSSPENTLLSPEILMALIAMPITIVSYAGRKKTETTNGQTSHNSTKETP